MRRITDLLAPLAADAGNVPADRDEAAALARQAQQERELLFAQRTWDYFRSKLTLRDRKEQRPMLRCADEFAWSCYRPAWEMARQVQTIAAHELKEPPLVDLTGSETPFVQVRQGRYRPEGVGVEDVRNYGDLLMLPIPVIGLPWSQVKQVALFVTLAHEVGHAVDEDFGVGELRRTRRSRPGCRAGRPPHSVAGLAPGTLRRCLRRALCWAGTPDCPLRLPGDDARGGCVRTG